MNKERLKYLHQRYRAKSLTPLEREEWRLLINDLSLESELKELLDEEWFGYSDDQLRVMPRDQADNMYEGIVQTQQESIAKNRTLLRWAIAAAVATIIFGAGLFIYKSKQINQVQTAVYANDVAPGKQGATLTLANGKKIRLSDAKNGDLASQAGVVVKKLDNGQLVYELKASDQVSTDLGAINTLSTSKGETYVLTLPDKSKVWLNSASSLTYSANLLKEGKRSVKLQGEAYFEIAKDKVHPFVVETGKQRVEVLGTHFNINSYTDEPVIATTLIEGSVKVSSNAGSKVLKPGQQSVLSGKEIKVVEANVENVIDWKDGDFNLDGIDFKVAMRRIARWYDVEVVYDASVPDDMLADGWISRNTKLSTILDVIQQSGLVKFKVEGRRVYVSR